MILVLTLGLVASRFVCWVFAAFVHFAAGGFFAGAWETPRHRLCFAAACFDLAVALYHIWALVAAAEGLAGPAIRYADLTGITMLRCCGALNGILIYRQFCCRLPAKCKARVASHVTQMLCFSQPELYG